MRELAVVYADAALDDLDDILTHVFAETGSIDLALAYVGRIEARCERIGHVPMGGTPRDAIVPGLRFVDFERRAIIAYIVENDAVVITNIFHGGRDYAAIIGSR